MIVFWRLPPHQGLQEHMKRGERRNIRPAHHMGNLLQRVVMHAGEMVGNANIFACQIRDS